MLDRIQDKFYEKRAGFEHIIVVLSLLTFALVLFAINVGSFWIEYFFLLGMPFTFSFVLTAFISTTYFLAATYFLKRKIDKFIQNPRNFREKLFKWYYVFIKFCLGLSLIWNTLGGLVLSLIFETPVHPKNQGYDPTALKLFIGALALLTSYLGLIIINVCAPMIGFGDVLSKRDSAFNFASKRGFSMCLGGFFVFFALLISAMLLDSKISTALNKTVDTINQVKTTNKDFYKKIN